MEAVCPAQFYILVVRKYIYIHVDVLIESRQWECKEVCIPVTLSHAMLMTSK